MVNSRILDVNHLSGNALKYNSTTRPAPESAGVLSADVVCSGVKFDIFGAKASPALVPPDLNFLFLAAVKSIAQALIDVVKKCHSTVLVKDIFLKS